MFHNYANSTTNTGDYPANVPKNGQNARADCDALATKLALEVPRTSNLSEFPLRVAFARYALSAKAGRRANSGNFPANVPKTNQNNNKRRRKNSGKCSTKWQCSIETQADRACVGSRSSRTPICLACVNRDAGRPSFH